MMNRYIQINEDKHLWGITLLLIASKIIEPEHNSIKIKKLVKTSKRAKFSNHIISEWEKRIWHLLEWKLAVVCPITYIEAGLQDGVILFNDQFCINDKGSKRSIKFRDSNRLNDVSQKLFDLKIEKFKKACNNYAHLSLKSAEIQTSSYKVQAAAIFLKSKEGIGIKSFKKERVYQMFEVDKDMVDICKSVIRIS